MGNTNKYYKKNREKFITKAKSWRKNNPERYKELNADRHDQIMFGGNKEKVLERDNFQCQNCGFNQEQHIVIYGYGLIVHHKDGKGKGCEHPNNNMNNLITLCRRCHTSLHSKERIGKKNPNHPEFVRKKIIKGT